MKQKIVIVFIALIIAIIPIPKTEDKAADIDPPRVPIIKAEVVKKIDPVKKVATPSIAQKPRIKQSTPAPLQSSNNEKIAWNFLTSQGYKRHQVAGIMGNLQQEHNFKTDDVPSGLGIAQWLGNRRANLMARDNYTDITVQLQFLVDELNTTEQIAKRALLASTTVEQATLAFSHKFERCGDCRDSQRIQYAYSFLSRY